MFRILLIFFFLLFISSCFNFRLSDEKAAKKIGKNERIDFEVKRYRVEERSIRYFRAVIDSTVEQAVLFIHGAPGSSKDYVDYLQHEPLLEKAALYAVDRPGYGYSDLGNSETSILRQVEIMTPLVKRLSENYETLILCGHSYGGAIIAALALSFPEKIDALVLLAPALDPELEKIFWFSYVGKIKPFRWLTPKALRVATDEKFAHEAALEDLWENLDSASFSGKVYHLHGDKDKIVSYENVRFSQKLFPQVRLIIIKGGNHFIPWKYEEKVMSVLNKLLNNPE